MKAKLFIVSLVSVCLQATNAASANYVCESEFLAGFKFNGDWVVNQGTYDYDKFLVSENEGVVSIRPFGDNGAPGFFPNECEAREFAIVCNSVTGQFRLSKVSRRYLDSYTLGFWDGVDNSDNTPNITIGSCAEM